MYLKKFSCMILLLYLLTSCAGLLLSPNAKLEFEQGLALFNQGKYANARPHFLKATELEPEYTKAYIYLGRSNLNMGQWIKAIPPLRTAYSLSPAETKKEAANFLLDAFIGGALEALKKGNFKQSISYLKEALDIDPESADVKTELAKAGVAYAGQLLSKGNFSDAISLFSEVLQYSPNNLDAYLGLAKAFLKNGDWLEAMRIIKDAMIIAPTEEDRSMFQKLIGQ
jgi:tetratricopeptide (TPR) repeat protein